MNDPLVAAAVRGTEREHAPPSTIPEIDALLAGLAVEGDERRILFAAGMLCIYGRAGCVPRDSATLPVAAPAEVLPPCSHQITAIVRELLNSRRLDLLREVLARMARAQLRLPHDLLPRVLNALDESVRPALVPVLGERGRWLARFNAEWRWVVDLVRERADALPPDAESIWQEGTLSERYQIVALHRRIAPAEALERLRGGFTREGARARARFLSALRIGLSGADEPFLEAALDDRSEAVRREAAALLIDLPESAYVARMRRRAEDMLRMRAGQGRRIGQRRLEVVRPDTVDEGWKRDGFEKKQSHVSRDAGQWQISQVIGAVPVRHWLDRFDLSMDALFASVEDPWRTELLVAWMTAAVRFGEQDLMPALWDACVDLVKDARTVAPLLLSLLRELAREMRPDDLDVRIANQLKSLDQKQGPWYAAVLETAPIPWSAQIGEMYLRLLAMGFEREQQGNADVAEWAQRLRVGGLGLPESLLDEGLALLSSPIAKARSSPARTVRFELQHDWRMRQRIREALPE